MSRSGFSVHQVGRGGLDEDLAAILKHDHFSRHIGFTEIGHAFHRFTLGQVLAEQIKGQSRLFPIKGGTPYIDGRRQP